jgi:hypothetical protein
MTGIDLTEFEKLNGRSRKKGCPIPGFLQDLRPKERAALQAALDAEDQVTGGALAAWLHKRGMETNHQFVVSHRRRTCTCCDD